MTFKKLALATAIVACAPMGAFAAEALDEEMLSAVTGQDGVRINLALNVNSDAIIHDTDGMSNAAVNTDHSFAGAIIVDNFGLVTGPGGITLEIDAGDTSTTGTAPVLNVNVAIAAGTTIDTGAISVGNSNRDDAAWGVSTQTGTIMQNTTITLGATTANIQLGNEAQGYMIALDTTITGGIVANNSAILDAGGAITGGAIGADVITLLDSGGGPNLTVDVGVDVSDTQGLVLTVNQLGDAVNGLDVRIEGQYLGTTTLGYVGDVELIGLDLNGSVISVTGKL